MKESFANSADPYSRRHFIKTGTSVAGLMTVQGFSRPALVRLGATPEPMPPIEDPRIRAMVERSLDAALSAGAAYADARITSTRGRFFALTNGAFTAEPQEFLGIGIRALVNGYWGFASGPILSLHEAARLGTMASLQAKAATAGPRRIVEFRPRTVAPQGHWETPIQIDPFTLDMNEVWDMLASLELSAARTSLGYVKVLSNACEFRVQDKAWGSSDGGYVTQRLYHGSGYFSFRISLSGTFPYVQPTQVGSLDDFLTPSRTGWELYAGQDLRVPIHAVLDSLSKEAQLPLEMVEVGRYRTLFDAASVARLLSASIGEASELDRAMGYEANGTGTSYITDPGTMVGALAVGSPKLEVTANRTDRLGCATVQWDDEGVRTGEFPLIRGGLLVGMQTTRESAGWMTDTNSATGWSATSNACSSAPSADEPPLCVTANLKMAPGPLGNTNSALRESVDSGLEVTRASVSFDWQKMSGLGTGNIFKIKNGKRIAKVVNAGFLFKTIELWKSLEMVGDASTVHTFGLTSEKGQPEQSSAHSVSAPAIRIKELSVIDVKRRA